MARGRQECLWEHTTALQAQILNLFRDDPISPDELHPFRQKRSRTRRGMLLNNSTLKHMRAMLRKRNAERG